MTDAPLESVIVTVRVETDLDTLAEPGARAHFDEWCKNRIGVECTLRDLPFNGTFEMQPQDTDDSGGFRAKPFLLVVTVPAKTAAKARRRMKNARARAGIPQPPDHIDITSIS